MAEKQTMPHAYAITLTYADVDGEPPLGARVYRYKDVSDMWKRIRSAGKRKWGENIELRYVIVGEKGTKFGRCHYHGVIFSSHPIVELGKLTSARGNGFAYKRRLDWTVWGHGFVEFQIADRKGMSYALKYILKARMTAERSKGYGREGKTEWLASSYLWCSKMPSVGATWLWQKLNDLVSKGMCPPALRVRVPGGGDWYVSSKLQQEMCLFLHQANNEYQQERGRNLAGWSTLIESVEGEIELSDTGELVKRKPWEWLVNGEEQEQNTEITAEQARAAFDALKDWYAHKRRIAAPITSARATLRNCGHILPCEDCATKLAGLRNVSLKQEYLLRFAEWQERHSQGSREPKSEYEGRFQDWWLTRLRPSRGCALRETELLQDQFRRLIPVTKAQHGLTAKGAVGKALQGSA
ncbi:rolling circle replication-associated protein [Pseudophaeobacter sp.]|uniref:rolling circle replication-associated protein n=1 Tax=Pseudophaeobacter sp. TaxID=1971739 RepID=UPI00405A020B